MLLRELRNDLDHCSSFAVQQRIFWSDQCDFAFKQALNMIAKAKLLHLPDFFEPFVAVTDAAKGQFACWAVYQRHKISKKTCADSLRQSMF